MSTPDKVQQLHRHFGLSSALDKEVLESVLEICAGDVQAAIQFLEIQNNDQAQVQVFNNYVRNSGQGGSTLPVDYMTKPSNWMDPSSKKAKLDAKQEKAIQFKKIFLEDATLVDHVKFQLDVQQKMYYTAVLILLLHQGVEMSHATKTRILVAVWAAKDWKMADYLLGKYDKSFGLIEILAALKILDAPRRIKALEKKIAKKKQSSANQKVITKLRAQINDVKQNMVPDTITTTSVSGSLAKKVRNWCAKIPVEQLSFFALHLPKEPWKELADICHMSPSKDFKLDYFLKYSFDEPAPQDSVIEACKNMNPNNLMDIVKKYHVSYSYLRKQVAQISPAVRVEICKYETLDTVIWWYEELSNGCTVEVDAIITERFNKGETVSFGYGKLMERLLLFKQLQTSFYSKLLPLAETKLQNYKLPLDPVVVVAGDASFSMDVAIRTSTIIASVVVALTNDAELRFFNVQSYQAPYLPKSAAQVLELSTTTKADGLTAPACILQEYYTKKKPIKIFILVTDEIENEKSNATFFAQLFYKYYMEVYPARIVMISFLENPNVNTKGRMTKALETMGIQPTIFTLDCSRPDLTKLDKILGVLSSETGNFAKQVEVLQEAMKGKTPDEALSLVFQKKTKEKKDKKKKPKQPSAEDNLLTETPKKSDPKVVSVSTVNEDGIPHEFLCPITHEVMKEPVSAADGFVYEHVAITEWFTKHDTSPMTQKPMEVKLLFPNYTLRSRILEFLDKREKK